MPLKSTGNIIKKIKINKKNIVLYFDDEKISISEQAYSLNYLYVGKSLSRKQIKDLEDFSSLEKALNYALGLLKRGHYSEYRIREKLYNKEYSKKDVDGVITFLKKHDLINDEMFALDYKSYADERNLGKNRIINDLKNRGIFDKTINKLKFLDSTEKKKVLKQLKALEKRYASLSYKNKKQHIYSSLLSLGFDHDIASFAINQMKEKSDKEENNNLRKDFDKLYHRLSSRYEGRELMEKMMKTLRNKGYRYNDIKKMMEEIDHEIC